MMRQIWIRARAIRSILLGKPTAYRLSFDAPVPFNDAEMIGGYVANCTVRV